MREKLPRFHLVTRADVVDRPVPICLEGSCAVEVLRYTESVPLQVREALTLLDLDVLIYPCPKGGTTFRPRARELSGKEQFPFLVDPNTGANLVLGERCQDYMVGLGSFWRLC